MKKTDREKLDKVLKRAQKTAIEYYELTGKPLGITGEIGECLAAKHLNLELALARSAGYDAIQKKGRKLVQIKTRKLSRTNLRKTGRIGALKFNHKWDIAILVLLDEQFEPIGMYEAARDDLKKAIRKPGSKARERGALGISQFIRLAEKVWPKTKGHNEG